MLVQQQKLQLSTYSDLYDLIVPKDNLLRKINELIDFSFIYDELVNKYCSNNGRNAESPIRIGRPQRMSKLTAYKEQIRQTAGVESVATSSILPGKEIL